jgi:hypothetical protein
MKREWMWAILALAIAVVLAYVLVNMSKDAESKVNVCVTPEQRDHIRDVMLKAIDKALDEQVGKLFANWVVDATEQPKRAQVGTNNSLKAYIVAKANILAWDPAECAASFQLQSADARPWR